MNLFDFNLSLLSNQISNTMKTMKTLLLSLSLILAFGSQAFSATRTVSNSSGDVAQYTSLQAAIADSDEGDIILISGSTVSYGDVGISIRLTLIGPGSNIDFNGGSNATIGTITFSSSQASKSVLQGLRISTITIGVPDCDEVQVKRCDVSQVVHSVTDATRIPQKWLLEESVVFSSGISNYRDQNLPANWSIRNCYLFGTLQLNGSIFTNNVFYAGSQSNTSANIFTNNIFISYSFNGIIQSSFANNIFDNTPAIDFTANSSSGNFFETDPQIVNFQWRNFFGGDNSLQPGSPGISAGTDGTDIGIFGGRGFLITGIPGIPTVESFIILNPTVPQNGTLNIKVEGKANN